MADSSEKVGVLIPCNKGEEESDDSMSVISVFKGANVVGRGNLPVVDKRVSRKHVCLVGKDDGSVEVVVEGPNPIVIQSGLDRKKFSSHEKAELLHNNIVELIPGCFAYKYKSLIDEKNASLRNDEKLVVNTSSLKRKHQALEDEAYARTLQEELWNGSISTTDKFDTPSKVNADRSSCSLDSMRRFSVSSEILPLTFRLLRVQGIPAWANTSSVSIDDVIEGNVLVAVLSNYMVDIDWLIGACPLLKRISHVLVIHGEKGASLEHMKVQLKRKHSNWVLHQPPLPISYGTHHSKAMLLVYPHGVRVVVHTANLIHVDWNNKSQGVWMQDFPLKELNDETEECAFENDLIGYLTALKLPDLWVNCPPFGNVNINASFFKKFDYRSAKVRLIASVPGYHSGSNLKRWGHMKLRDVLHSCCFDKVFQNSSLLYQFSSLGSLDEKWMDEFACSMSSGMSDDKMPLGLGKAQIIWPTVEDVRCSLEGYAAGNAIPSPLKNVEKEFLKKYWARWQADHSGRGRAMPHIKSYTRYSGQNLAWFLLTSANLSKAAWGALQKKNSQLMIRSYELGVLFLPSQTTKPTCGFSCSKAIGSSQKLAGTKTPMTKLVTLCWQVNSEESSEVVKFPIPYQIPPRPYSPEDIPWSWDRRYLKKDVFGQVWPHHVQLYIDENT